MNIIKKFKQFYILLSLSFLYVANSYCNVIENEENIMGSKGAKNVLVEYASLSCVHCANFHNNKLPEIKKKLISKGKLIYIYKDFPLDLPAMLASMLSHCYKGEQYFAVLKSLFRNQKKWVSNSENREKLMDSFYLILKEHGISRKKIIECTNDTPENKKKWDSILSTRLEGQKQGVNSTPTFFLNGKKLQGPVDIDLIKENIY